MVGEETVAVFLAILGRTGGIGGAVFEDDLGLGEMAAERGARAEEDQGRVAGTAVDQQLGGGECLGVVPGGDARIAGLARPTLAESGEAGGREIGDGGTAGLGGEIGTGLGKDRAQLGIVHRGQIVAGAFQEAAVDAPRCAGQPGGDMGNQHAFAVVEVFFNRDAVTEALVQAGLGAPGLGEGGGAEDGAWPPIGDAQDHPAAALVGQRHAVVDEFLEMEAARGGLELDVGALRSIEQAAKFFGRGRHQGGVINAVSFNT